MPLFILSFVLIWLLCGCTVGPDYQRPNVTSPAALSDPSADWKVATPQDAIGKGPWWEIFGDPELNRLEQATREQNQDLRAAVSRVDQARDLARLAKSDFWPTVAADPSGSVYRNSGNRPLPPPAPRESFSSTDLEAPLDLSYEADLWGRVRRSYESSQANFQASVADYENIRLTLHAETAQVYFQLRAKDSEVSILQESIRLRRQSFSLIDDRFRNGASSELEVAQATNALATAEADLSSARKDRSNLEHALAVLVGQPAQSFQLRALDLHGTPVAVPLETPSELLERRPDIAEAERRMASANALIGVAKAAFFPVVKLTGTAGLESVNAGSLFNWSSRLWAVGPSISLPIFDAGRNAANYSRAEAQYLETVASYRQRVLQAFQEVADGLSNTTLETEQANALTRAVDASKRAYEVADQRYREGSVSYLEVVDAQRTYLENQRAAVLTQGQRFVTTILLIKALGGGWQDSHLSDAPLALATAAGTAHSEP